MVYKVRVILDSKESVFRDIEIKEKQTLWNLHLGVKSAFSLQGDELSMFTILDDEGIEIKSVPLEDIVMMVMAKLCQMFILWKLSKR
jgi:hypothetical protein